MDALLVGVGVAGGLLLKDLLEAVLVVVISRRQTKQLKANMREVYEDLKAKGKVGT